MLNLIEGTHVNGPFAIAFGTAYEVGPNDVIACSTLGELVKVINEREKYDDCYWIACDKDGIQLDSEFSRFGNTNSDTEVTVVGLKKRMFIDKHSLKRLPVQVTDGL